MFKTILLVLVSLVGIVLLAFVLIGRERCWELLAGSADRGQHDFNKGSRSSTPNDALACSPGLCENPNFEIAPVDDAPQVAIKRLSQRLLRMDPLARRVDDRTDAARARFVTHSPVMRFPDIIHLEARPLPDGRTGLMAYARAQLGNSDLGKNRGRLEALFAGR